MSAPSPPSAPPPEATPTAAAVETAEPGARRLVLVAPHEFWTPVSEAFAAAGVVVTPRERPPAGDDRRDPYGVAARAATPPARDGLLLVAPTNRGPRRLVPGPLAGGVPVGVVQADAPADLAAWLAAVRASAPAAAEPPRRAVLAMGKDRFLELGGEVLARLADAGEPIDWRADRVSRTGLAARLATGPTLALYLGHGRARGWSGYQAFRWGEIETEPQIRPTGTVVALACDTLTRHRMAVPFGVRLVAAGRACSYLGAAASVRTTAAETLARTLADCLAEDTPATVGDLLRGVSTRLERAGETAVRRDLSRFRLVGSPFAPV